MQHYWGIEKDPKGFCVVRYGGSDLWFFPDAYGRPIEIMGVPYTNIDDTVYIKRTVIGICYVAKTLSGRKTFGGKFSLLRETFCNYVAAALNAFEESCDYNVLHNHAQDLTPHHIKSRRMRELLKSAA